MADFIPYSGIDNLPGTTVTWDQLMMQNTVVRDWAIKVKAELKSSAAQFTKGKKGTITRPAANGPLRRKYPNIREWKEFKLKDKLDHRIYNEYGIASGIGFRIQKHGVFRHYGTGSGYKVVNGTLTKRNGGPINRQPVDWFNHVIDMNTDDLADKMALVNEEMVVNAMRMKIV